MGGPVSDDDEATGPRSRPGEVRLIKRYANRKLYDTGIGQLTSLHRIEQLIRAGADIRVVDHDTGADITAELLVAILSGSFGEHARDDEVATLLSLIRSPGTLLEAAAGGEVLAEQLRAIRERIRLLSATLDALLVNASDPAPASAVPADGVHRAQ